MSNITEWANEHLEHFHIEEPVDLSRLPVYCEIWNAEIHLTVGVNNIPFGTWLEDELNTTVERLTKAFKKRDVKKQEQHFNEDLFTL
jgi:hypothetical protein